MFTFLEMLALVQSETVCKVKAVSVPSSFIGGLRGSKWPAILLTLFFFFFFFFFEILSDLNQAVPNHLADKTQIVSRIHHQNLKKKKKKTFRVGSPQSPFSIPSSLILFFVLLPLFLKTKILSTQPNVPISIRARTFAGKRASITFRFHCITAPCLGQLFSIVFVFLSDFTEPVLSLGCWNVPTVTRSFTSTGKDNNPGVCADACFPGLQPGYIAVDMGSDPGSNEGNCSCLAGEGYGDRGAATGCTETCGGASQAFPGYLCGSRTNLVGTVYRKPGGMISILWYID